MFLFQYLSTLLTVSPISLYTNITRINNEYFNYFFLYKSFAFAYIHVVMYKYIMDSIVRNEKR